MVIDFQQIEASVIHQFRGGEKDTVARLFNDERNRLMLARLAPGASIGMHTHDTSSEIVYVLEGEGKALCDGEEERVRAGSCHYCPKGHTHSLINDGAADLVFFAVVPQQ